jgi:hypothetical protein
MSKGIYFTQWKKSRVGSHLEVSKPQKRPTSDGGLILLKKLYILRFIKDKRTGES